MTDSGAPPHNGGPGRASGYVIDRAGEGHEPDAPVTRKAAGNGSCGADFMIPWFRIVQLLGGDNTVRRWFRRGRASASDSRRPRPL